MKYISLSDVNTWSKVYRLNFINSLSGYKSANLIGTTGSKGENLAIFSSVVHLGANPPLLGFIMRPTTVGRDTYRNIKENGYFTVNHIHEDFIQKAHYTSAKFPFGESEFDKVNLKAEYINFKAPFVKESKVKMGLKLVEEKPIESNGTIFLIGLIEQIIIDEGCIQDNGQLDLNKVKDVCISGLNIYHKVEEIDCFPYARVEELPNFD